MRWHEWLQHRTITRALGIMLSLPLGAPSAFAMPSLRSEALRPPSTDNDPTPDAEPGSRVEQRIVDDLQARQVRPPSLIHRPGDPRRVDLELGAASAYFGLEPSARVLIDAAISEVVIPDAAQRIVARESLARFKIGTFTEDVTREKLTEFLDADLAQAIIRGISGAIGMAGGTPASQPGQTYGGLSPNEKVILAPLVREARELLTPPGGMRTLDSSEELRDLLILDALATAHKAERLDVVAQAAKTLSSFGINRDLAEALTRRAHSPTGMYGSSLGPADDAAEDPEPARAASARLTDGVWFWNQDGGTMSEEEGRNLLGGKGYNLWVMSKLLDLPVPPFGTIPTDAANDYLDGRITDEDVRRLNDSIIQRLEEETGEEFGGRNRPLLVSDRSGARISMPGMMDTILNIGLNDETVEGFARRTNERAAWDSYRRLIQMFGGVVLEIGDADHDPYEEALEALKTRRGVREDTKLTADDFRQLVETFKEITVKESRKEFPQDVREQLLLSTVAVFKSWNSERAQVYRRRNRIPENWGTAVNIVHMVFGNTGDQSMTGVTFTRNENTGDPGLHGEFLVNAQGEDVVAGIRDNETMDALAERFPEVYAALQDAAATLEAHFHDMQDMEWTVQDGELWMLQTRDGKRSGQAALRIALDLLKAGEITKEAAILQVSPQDHLEPLLHDQFDPKALDTALELGSGLPASPGAARGVIALTSQQAVELHRQQLKEQQALPEDERKPLKGVILFRTATSQNDMAGINVARGIVTRIGGTTSHAALVARGIGKPAVVGIGTEDVEINIEAGRVTIRGIEYRAGEDMLSIDGTARAETGNRGYLYEGELDTIPSEIIQYAQKEDQEAARQDSELYDQYVRFMALVSEVSQEQGGMGSMANADNGPDALLAKRLGARGIGLTRTEHMFQEEKTRLPLVRRMLVGALTDNERLQRLAIEAVEPMQSEDFRGIFNAMDGLPVVIRLLDPPLHEFLPDLNDSEDDKAVQALAQAAGTPGQKMRDILAGLAEDNPMMGYRGVRLLLKYPEIARMQVRAIINAAIDEQAEGVEVHPKIMVPVVAYAGEYQAMHQKIKEEADRVIRERKVSLEYQIGTMIEITRAPLVADEIAALGDFVMIQDGANFYSFGTNDLTQTVKALSRDDYGRHIAAYLEQGLYDNDPFATIDREPLALVALTRLLVGPDFECGVCGEHGGDPISIERFHGYLDYVSGSPYRVPIENLATAQALLSEDDATKAWIRETAERLYGRVQAVRNDNIGSPRETTQRVRVSTGSHVNTARQRKSSAIDVDLTAVILADRRSRSSLQQAILAGIGADDEAVFDEAIGKFQEQLQEVLQGLLNAGSFADVSFNLVDVSPIELLQFSDEEHRQFAGELGLTRLELAARIARFTDENRMIGTRGPRLLMAWGEHGAKFFEAQISAAHQAWQAVPERGTAQLNIPFLTDESELGPVLASVKRAAGEADLRDSDFRIGVVIETPSGAMNAADFVTAVQREGFEASIVFDLMDLTQTTVGMGEGDVKEYLRFAVDEGIIPVHPFKALDREGVLVLLLDAALEARRVQPDIRIAVTGPQLTDRVSHTTLARVVDEFIMGLHEEIVPDAGPTRTPIAPGPTVPLPGTPVFSPAMAPLVQTPEEEPRVAFLTYAQVAEGFNSLSQHGLPLTAYDVVAEAGTFNFRAADGSTSDQETVGAVLADTANRVLGRLPERIEEANGDALLDYFNARMKHEDNTARPIRIRVSDRLELVDSARYLNEDTGEVEIILSAAFASVMIPEMLAERLFRELGKDNAWVHVDSDTRIEKERDLAEWDFQLFDRVTMQTAQARIDTYVDTLEERGAPTHAKFYFEYLRSLRDDGLDLEERRQRFNLLLGRGIRGAESGQILAMGAMATENSLGVIPYAEVEPGLQRAYNTVLVAERGVSVDTPVSFIPGVGGGKEAQVYSQVLGRAFELLRQHVGTLEDDLGTRFRERLGSADNQFQFRFLVSNALPAIGGRYFNNGTNEIIFPQDFVDFVIKIWPTADERTKDALAWMVAERLSHELLHRNRSGDYRADEIEQVTWDLALLTRVTKPLGFQAAISRLTDRPDATFMSGRYFQKTLEGFAGMASEAKRDSAIRQFVKARVPADVGSGQLLAMGMDSVTSEDQEIEMIPVNLTAEERAAVAFGTAGWRAEFPDAEHPDGTFTPERVRLLVQATAEEIIDRQSEYAEAGLVDEEGHPVVVIGYDHRNRGQHPDTGEWLSQEAYAEDAARILAANGVAVRLMDRAASTPLNVFAMHELKAAAMINLTASHNQAADGGIEIFDGLTGGLANDTLTDPIVEWVHRDPENPEAIQDISRASADHPLIERIEPNVQGYADYVRETLGVDPDVIRESGIRVIVDAQFGMGTVLGEVIKELDIAVGTLEQLQAGEVQVAFINDELDPDFGGKRNVEATPENLEGLSEAIVRYGADLGLSMDGDGDRAGALTANLFFNGNDLASTLAYGALKQARKEAGEAWDPTRYVIVRSAVSTAWIDAIAASFGVPEENIRTTAVGFRFLNEAIHQAREERKIVVLAFEENGGVAIGNAIPYKDGFGTDLSFLTIAARAKLEGKTVEDLFAEAQAAAGRPEWFRTDIELDVADAEVAAPYKGKSGLVMQRFNQIAEELEATLREQPAATLEIPRGETLNVVAVGRSDGVHVKFEDDSWIIVRPSGTEPIFRVYVEAATTEANADITEWATAITDQFERQAQAALQAKAEAQLQAAIDEAEAQGWQVERLPGPEANVPYRTVERPTTDAPKKRVAVVGPGAMGTLVGSHLAAYAEDTEVFMIDRRAERAEQLQEQGLKVQVQGRPEENFQVSVDFAGSVQEAQERLASQGEETLDAVFVTTNAHQLSGALESVKPLIGPDTTIIIAPNGEGLVQVATEALRGWHNREWDHNIVRGLLFHGFTPAGPDYPGQGTYTSPDGHVTLGGDGEHLASADTLLREARLDPRTSANIQRAEWEKLLGNGILNGLTMLTQVRNGRLRDMEQTQWLIRLLGGEIVKVGKAVGAFGAEESATDLITQYGRGLIDATPENVNSMLTAHLNGVPSEISEINGKVVTEGERNGIATPVNAWLVSKVKEKELAAGAGPRQGSPEFALAVLKQHPGEWLTGAEVSERGGITDVVVGTTKRDLLSLAQDADSGVIRRRRGREGYAYTYDPTRDALARAEQQPRRPIIGGNWKMAVETEAEARALLRGIAEQLDGIEDADIVVAASFVHLPTLRNALRRLEGQGVVPKGRIHLGAQDVSAEEPGAHTGEVSYAELLDLGVTYVLVGHSEQRHGPAKQSSELVNAKVKILLANGLKPIVAVGETLEELDAGRAQQALEAQIRKSLADLSSEEMANVAIAYEPVWAIGTGLSATPEQANEAQRSIRGLLLEMFGYEVAARTRIQYGGSVNPGNVAGLIAQPNIDGGLIGGASLNPDDFVQIVRTANEFAEAADDDLAGITHTVEMSGPAEEPAPATVVAIDRQQVERHSPALTRPYPEHVRDYFTSDETPTTAGVIHADFFLEDPDAAFVLAAFLEEFGGQQKIKWVFYDPGSYTHEGATLYFHSLRETIRAQTGIDLRDYFSLAAGGEDAAGLVEYVASELEGVPISVVYGSSQLQREFDRLYDEERPELRPAIAERLTTVVFDLHGTVAAWKPAARPGRVPQPAASAVAVWEDERITTSAAAAFKAGLAVLADRTSPSTVRGKPRFNSAVRTELTALRVNVEAHTAVGKAGRKVTLVPLPKPAEQGFYEQLQSYRERVRSL